MDESPAKVHVLNTVFLTLSILAVILRLVARRRQQSALGADDFLIILALVSSPVQ